MGKMWSAAENHTLFDDMTKKRDILFSNRGNGAALSKAFMMLEAITSDLADAVDQGEPGVFTTPPALYIAHCVIEKKRKSDLEKEQTREAKKDLHRRRSQEPKSAKRQTRGYADSKTLPPHESRSLPELQKPKAPKSQHQR